MANGKFPKTNQLEIPFELRKVKGTVTARMEENLDGHAWGNDLITSHFKLKENAANGFPTMSAWIDHPSKGYAAMLGWIQFVEEKSPHSLILDQFPAFQGNNTPFFAWGVKPALFDSPFGQKDRDWTATTYLCQLSDACLTKSVESPLAAFKWGFVVDAEGEVSEVKRVEQIELVFREDERRLLAQEFPDWTFL